MNGILCGIGVGPGDPELLTLKAVRKIKESDIILLPAATRESCHSYGIARLAVPEIDEKEIICRNFPMTRDTAALDAAHDAIAEEVLGWMRQGKKVAFLTIGDPTVYSTFTYIASRIRVAGGQTETISGIPSFCAAAARLGISLGDREEQIRIIPGSAAVRMVSGEDSGNAAVRMVSGEDSGKAAVRDLSGADSGNSATRMETADIDTESETRIYMKSGRKLAELKAVLREEQQALQEGEELQIYSVSNCGMANEETGCGLEEIPEKKGYLTLVIVKRMLRKS